MRCKGYSVYWPSFFGRAYYTYFRSFIFVPDALLYFFHVSFVMVDAIIFLFTNILTASQKNWVYGIGLE